MTLALVTDATVTANHGTGNLLLRLLEGSGVSVSAFHPGASHGTPAIQTFDVRGRRTAAGLQDAVRRGLPSFVRGRQPSPGSIRRFRYRPDTDAAARLAEARLMLTVVHTPEGLRFAHDLIASLAPATPVVLWFMDLLISPEDLDNVDRTLPRLRQARLWAFNSRIKAGLAELFPEKRGEVEQHMYLGVPLPAQSPKPAAPITDNTRCVMIGNFWDVSVLPLLDAVWQRVCAQLGVALPLHWFGPQEALARVTGAGASLGRSIRYEGHADNLDAVLRQADVAIMPFSSPSEAPHPFTRHSFPSRVADFAAHGLPVFAICGRETPLADYLSESGAGIYDTADSVDRAANACADFLRSMPLRERCSHNARAYAESHFDLDQQRKAFASALSALVSNESRSPQARTS